MVDSEGIIQRKALGRTAAIGSMYDATKDTFCKTTIFKTELPLNSIKRVDIPNASVMYEYEDSYMEKFKNLDVEPQLRISVLSGLVLLDGSGKYLNDIKESSRSVKGTLVYKITSVEENLEIYRENVKACISTDAFNTSEATHVVIGVKWGAAIMASFEYTDTNKENKSQVSGELRSNLEKIKSSISAGAHVNVETGSHNTTNQFSIKLLGDFIPDKIPQSFEDARELLSNLPLYIKTYNDGKGVPIEYTLYPLSELSKILSQNSSVDRMIKELSEETILRVDQIFNDLFKSKQKLNDLHNDVKSISQFIPDELFDEISKHVQKVNLEEAKFRSELSKCLINIRSGEDNHNKLENNIQTFQQSVLSETSIASFINKYKSVSMKADLIPILKARGMDYLSKNMTINKILLEHPKNHVYIFVDTDDYIINIDSPVWNAFLDISSMNEGSSKFFIFNPTLYTGIDRPNDPVIHHYINGRLSSRDYYNDKKKLFTSNIIKFNTLPCIKPNYSPNKKERLMVPCPRSLTNDCSHLNCEWICIRCEQYVEYGYNKHLYCDCGESKIDHCEFKCNNSLHISGYNPFDQNKLAEFLPVAPREEINILLLGETGAGKSTFINAFANYFKFNSLDDAISGEIDALITSSFTITNENCETKTITIVSKDEDKSDVVDNVGGSTTKECGVYVFHAGENKIRFIDTPGIGDTRGIEYDEKNIENILKNIRYHEDLNGICILLKPNNARLNIIFKYCIQELLSHLHKNAKDNIVFCFTNTRGTFFRPGDTLPVLKKQINEIEKQSDIKINICKDTLYCFDNDSFRFLAAIKDGSTYSESAKKNYIQSWENSVNEAVRLFKYIVSCTPHNINDTVSLNNARQTVMIFCEPLAKINRNIQENLAKIKELKEEIERADLTEEELRSKLYIPHIELKITLLKEPRVRCKNCKMRNINNKDTRNCDVQFKWLNSLILEYYGIMMFGTCKSCDCPAKRHEAVFYESTSEYSKVDNIENKISENKKDQNNRKDHIRILQEKIDQLKERQNTVDEIIIQFTQFLMQNAIAVFNDTYAEYLDYIIHLERENVNNTSNNEILKGLEEIKSKYDENVKIIKTKIENNEASSSPLSSEDIFNLEQQLYSLPDISQYLQDIKKEEEKAFIYQERHYELSGNISNVFTKIFRM
ncbi:p-loop containing nucleoside triphosphate hydrolase [Gigaspora margarita]|uniref:p-loop containing nucleoside triphosphate hydrolase n=1 Tax=Gigaspora margarita TaxID=4874 RepID=A0A8H4EPX3_GIGMA|nr:p-loop containing nucleoside triphosphate hydrolase [Gigaspora margarita]